MVYCKGFFYESVFKGIQLNIRLKLYYSIEDVTLYFMIITIKRRYKIELIIFLISCKVPF